MPFAVEPYDPGWPQVFAAERSRLAGVLAPWLTAPIEHVGSTAIPGMPAKPVIDMLAGVRDLAEARAAIGPLDDAGYRHQAHRLDALWFYAPAGAASLWDHTFHLHLTEVGSPLWRERLAFRDLLRADPHIGEEYRAVKERLAADSAGAGYDGAGKRAFVASVLARAGIDLGAPAGAESDGGA